MQKILILGPRDVSIELIRALVQIGTSPMTHAFLEAPTKSYPEKIDMEPLVIYKAPKIHTYPIARRGARNNHQAMRAQVVRHTSKPLRKKSIRNR